MITLTREEAQQVLDAMIPYQQKVIATTKEYGVTVSVNNEIETAIEILRARLSAPEPEPVRLRRGDTLRCIETNELCTVWATSTTGKTLVKWKANDFGSYTAEQIGDLFWVEPKHEPEPVACPKEPENIEELYTAPPQREWQGLTDEEILGEYRQSYGDDGNLTDVYFARAIEAKLKEKNT